MVEGSWGWNCQARCVPDVEGRRLALAKPWREQPRGKEDQNGEVGDFSDIGRGCWCRLRICWNLHRITTDFRVYGEWRKKRKKMWATLVYKVFSGHITQSHRIVATPQQDALPARLNSFKLPTKCELHQRLDVSSFGAGREGLFKHIFSCTSALFKKQVRWLAINKSKMGKSHTAKTDKADEGCWQDTVSFRFWLDSTSFSFFLFLTEPKCQECRVKSEWVNEQLVGEHSQETKKKKKFHFLDSSCKLLINYAECQFLDYTFNILEFTAPLLGLNVHSSGPDACGSKPWVKLIFKGPWGKISSI